MQLSKQCTWISLNLTRISNQARRWVEGVFSSSMYVSSNQMCKREPPKAGHQLFIIPLKETSRWLFSLGWKRGHRTLPSDHRMLDLQRPVLSGWPRVLLESRVSDPNGHLRITGCSAGPHWTRPVHTGLIRREFRKPAGHRTLSTGSVRCSPDPCTERVAKRPHTGC